LIIKNAGKLFFGKKQSDSAAKAELLGHYLKKDIPKGAVWV